LFFPYWLTVLIISLALYGLWQFGRDLLGLWSGSGRGRPLSVSLLIVVRNAEDTVEYQLRRLLGETALEPAWQEIVIVDHGSDDLTAPILDRLAAGCPRLKIVHLPLAARPIGDALAFCRGDVVQILDMVNRLESTDWDAAVRMLIRR
jgi:glycosyltransferase involved in cell wall biosynthesis